MIINPWFFYLMGLCNNVLSAAIIVAIICVVGAALLSIPLGIALVDGDENNIKRFAPIIRILITVFVVSMLIYIVVPTENTILMMQAARITTTDNVKTVFEALKSAIDYAVNILKQGGT